MKTSGTYRSIVALSVLLVVCFLVETVSAIPIFARRYGVSCTVCHVGFPKLNGFGESFAANGYQFPDEDLKSQTVETGDEKLNLLKTPPLAIRADSFFRVRDDTDTTNDLQSPFSIKVLSSAPIKKNISYYFYFFYNERGGVTGVEDAFIYFNDAYKDVDLDLRIGQFQVMDRVFAREQRLTFQDYTYYATAISDSGFNLTYDRAAELSYKFNINSSLGMGMSAGVANGNGIGVANSQRNFDSDNFKNFFGKVYLERGSNNVGLYGYSGREKNLSGVRNEFYRIGPDFNFWIADSIHLWGNVLYGEDKNGRFAVGTPGDIRSWGGFTGITYKFDDDWIASFLYNRVEVDGKQQLNANTVTGNIAYYLMRNFKVMFEVTGDLESKGPFHPEKQHTGIVGIVLAY